MTAIACAEILRRQFVRLLHQFHLIEAVTDSITAPQDTISNEVQSSAEAYQQVQASLQDFYIPEDNSAAQVALAIQEMNIRGNTTRYFFIFSRSAVFLGFKRALRSSSHFIGNRFYRIRLTDLNMMDVFNLHFGAVSESHFIASVSEDKECYENKCSQHYSHYSESLLLGEVSG